MSGLYAGVLNGSVQATVFDQTATALPGQPYSATDQNMVDSINVAATNGVNAGLGVSASYVTSSRPGINAKACNLPTSASTDANFEGVIVRSQAIRSDSNGNPIVPMGAQASIMRRKRLGGRIWVNSVVPCTAGGPVYWLVQDTGASGYPIGSLVPAAQGAAGIDTVLLTNVVFASTSTAAGQPVLVEMGA